MFGKGVDQMFGWEYETKEDRSEVYFDMVARLANVQGYIEHHDGKEEVQAVIQHIKALKANDE